MPEAAALVGDQPGVPVTLPGVRVVEDLHALGADAPGVVGRQVDDPAIAAVPALEDAARIALGQRPVRMRADDEMLEVARVDEIIITSEPVPGGGNAAGLIQVLPPSCDTQNP